MLYRVLVTCWSLLIVAHFLRAQPLRFAETRQQFVAACMPADSNGNRSFVPDSNSVFFAFAQSNRRFIEYLFINAQALKSQYLWAHPDDSSRFAGKVQDTTWNNLLFEELKPLIDNYFFVQQSKHAEGVPPRGQEKISATELRQSGVRFFDPFLFQGNQIAMHICVGANGFQGMHPPRDFMIEAFCYSAIMEQLQDDALMTDVGHALTALHGVELDGTASEIRNQLRSHVWREMNESSALTAVLQKEYTRMQDWLPFRLEKK